MWEKMVEKTPIVEFVSTSGNLWEVTREEGDFQYYKNGIPQNSEKKYHAALANNLPGSVTRNPYDVVDEFTPDELDRLATRRDDLNAEEKMALKDVETSYTVQHSYRNVEAVNDWFTEEGIHPEDIEGVEDLQDLGVIDSEDIRDNQPPQDEKYRFRNSNADIDRPFTTSASTGVPKWIFKSFDEMVRIPQDLERGFSHWGVTDDDIYVNYLPFVGLNPSSYYTESAMGRMGVETVPLSNTDYPDDTEFRMLMDYPGGVDVVNGLASHVDAKGRRWKKKGMDPSELDVKLVSVSGEPISPARKENLEDTWGGAAVKEFLGSTESGGFAYECNSDRGVLHVLDDSVHVDIVDGEGEGVPRGEEGEMAITNLLYPGEESAMPLIRYKPGDITRRVDEPGCECDIAGYSIESPHRTQWEFIFGAVNLDTLTLEGEIFDHPQIGSAVEEYKIELDYDREAGQETMQISIGTVEEELVGTSVEDVGYREIERGQMDPGEDSDALLQSLANNLFDSDPHLQDTVDEVDSARIDISVVSTDEIDLGKGKPSRLVDNR